MSNIHDLAIIGGGINGCGIARDAAGRGLSVVLAEMGDLAGATSSRSTKLIHGGLRYLEYYEFRLVREALMEREVLWAIAPHIVRPLRFVLPYHRGLRPAWLLRLGLFLYDHLGGRKLLPPTRTLDLKNGFEGRPLHAGEFERGFAYSDCGVDDARLVVLNARDAADRGADIRTRTKVTAIAEEAGVWVLTLESVEDGRRQTVSARALVNAAGPWIEQVLAQRRDVVPRARVRLVQGSHIVVRRLYEGEHAYIFQNTDGRIVFAIPYEQDFTLIGTTDREYTGDPAKVAATPEEIDYLCRLASESFARPVTPADVVWTYSGVRPLYDDGASEAKAATRDYVLELDRATGGAPLLSVFGGKITTYRRLAEEVLEKLAADLPEPAGGQPAGWTARAPLPGGDFPVGTVTELAGALRADYPFLTAAHADRLAHAYGTRARAILGTARTLADLGAPLGATLTEAEVRHLVAREWARTADDVAWRRTKLGLRLSASELAALDAVMRGLTAAAADGEA
ncbi:MAG: glycerol-3-phosphate dehydrogenase [Hyphomicrobiaceae bacterium]